MNAPSNRQRSSVKQLMEETYPALILAANRAGMVTQDWSFGTPYGRGFYLRDGERNISKGWFSTHDAKVGMEAMISILKPVSELMHE